jgi:hypothetical protein
MQNAPKYGASSQRRIEQTVGSKNYIPVRHTQWISNMVPVRKKNGDIRLCVDFRNLNKASEKDNYPCPTYGENFTMCLWFLKCSHY